MRVSEIIGKAASIFGKPLFVKPQMLCLREPDLPGRREPLELVCKPSVQREAQVEPRQAIEISSLWISVSTSPSLS